MEIRKASLHDLDTLVELNAEVQEIHIKIRPDIFKFPGTTEIRKAFLSMIDDLNYLVFLCSHQGNDVGYFILHLIRKDAHAFKFSEKYIELEQISILKKYRHKGIGKAILEYIKQTAHQLSIDRIDLTVWTENTQSLEAFKKLEFQEMYRRMSIRI